ncbi:hypothetical protein SAMN05444392_101816 [Seinonella peptonophila]|uniref:Uncharacterized protein n=1 Tax=Seinonella peptonophila TaxID=112248 RepID=A0A1M4U524_9BACL|nr:hypothetical protein [Seinonella peptonophila]SHE51842.1 hypothetical protein SAMN05444392_101816 [Seinonella peptonophila]
MVRARKEWFTRIFGDKKQERHDILSPPKEFTQWSSIHLNSVGQAMKKLCHKADSVKPIEYMMVVLFTKQLVKFLDKNNEQLIPESENLKMVDQQLQPIIARLHTPSVRMKGSSFSFSLGWKKRVLELKQEFGNDYFADLKRLHEKYSSKSENLDRFIEYSREKIKGAMDVDQSKATDQGRNR